MPARPDRAAPRRLVFLHGFTQIHHHWHGAAHLIAERLEPTPTLAFVDLPGHGLAATDDTAITEAGASLAELAGAGVYVGYSMGGRFAVHAALARPDLVRALVLIGATPGISDPDDRAERRRLDDERADRLERDGVEQFLDEWLSAPLFASLASDRTGREHRLRNTASGLATSLRTAGTGVQESLWNRLRDIEVPTLVLAGELDDKFTDIGRRMAADVRFGEFGTIDGAGHAAHTEQPERFADVVAGWLTE